MEFRNENDQAIQVDPVTVEKVLVAPAEATSILVIGPLEIIVAGDPPQVASAIGTARGYACECVVPAEPEAPPAGGLPAGDADTAPPAGDAPPERAEVGDTAPPAVEEPERPATRSKGKGKNRPAWE